MICPLCQAFRAKYPLRDGKHHVARSITMDEIQCGFDTDDDDGKFKEDNWCCQTLAKLRELAEAHGFKKWWDDDNISVLAIPEVEETDDPDEKAQRGFLVLSWYKSRGRTSEALVVNSSRTEALRLKTAERIIKKYEPA